MLEFLKQYGILILALIGIIQYWIIAFWKKYIRKSKIEIYETGTIEIGYGPFGPSISLNGTLRALNKDVFIKSIDLMLVRKKDKSQHVFHWLAFRPPQVDLSGAQPISMEIPSGFLISPDSPHKYNIIFYDKDLFKEIKSLLRRYISEWYKMVLEPLTKTWSPSVGITPSAEIKAEQDKLIESFRKSTIRNDTFAALDRYCYWEPGDYSITINARTSKPDKFFTKDFKFSITENDLKTLRLNVITILDQPISAYLRIQNYPYFNTYSEYK